MARFNNEMDVRVALQAGEISAVQAEAELKTLFDARLSPDPGQMFPLPGLYRSAAQPPRPVSTRPYLQPNAAENMAKAVVKSWGGGNGTFPVNPQFLLGTDPEPFLTPGSYMKTPDVYLPKKPMETVTEETVGAGSVPYTPPPDTAPDTAPTPADTPRLEELVLGTDGKYHDVSTLGELAVSRFHLTMKQVTAALSNFGLTNHSPEWVRQTAIYPVDPNAPDKKETTQESHPAIPAGDTLVADIKKDMAGPEYVLNASGERVLNPDYKSESEALEMLTSHYEFDLGMSLNDASRLASEELGLGISYAREKGEERGKPFMESLNNIRKRQKRGDYTPLDVGAYLGGGSYNDFELAVLKAFTDDPIYEYSDEHMLYNWAREVAQDMWNTPTDKDWVFNPNTVKPAPEPYRSQGSGEQANIGKTTRGGRGMTQFTPWGDPAGLSADPQQSLVRRQLGMTPGGRQSLFSNWAYGGGSPTAFNPITRAAVQSQFEPLQTQYLLDQYLQPNWATPEITDYSTGAVTPATDTSFNWGRAGNQFTPFAEYLSGDPERWGFGGSTNKWAQVMDALGSMYTPDAEGSTSRSPGQLDLMELLRDPTVASNLVRGAARGMANPLLRDAAERRAANDMAAMAADAAMTGVPLFERFMQGSPFTVNREVGRT